MRAPRGFTIAETMVVAVILGMLLTAVVGAMAPLFGAPYRAQAKTDSLSPAASGMYLVERDLRESDANGIFACVGQPAACGDGSLGQADSAVVLPTALESADLGATFRLTAGTPNWQGFIVYWQPASGGFVYRAFEPESGLSQLINSMPPNRAQLQILANAAAASAMSDTPPEIAMRNISVLAASVNVNASATSLHVVATGYAGENTNTTTFDDDIFARN